MYFLAQAQENHLMLPYFHYLHSQKGKSNNPYRNQRDSAAAHMEAIHGTKQSTISYNTHLLLRTVSLIAFEILLSVSIATQ